MVGDIDNDAAAEAVITMDNCIQQGFADSLFGVILLIRPHHAFDDRARFVAQRKIVYGVLKLLEHRATKFLTVPEHGTGFVTEYGDFGCMSTLVGKD